MEEKFLTEKKNCTVSYVADIEATTSQLNAVLDKEVNLRNKITQAKLRRDNCLKAVNKNKDDQEEKLFQLKKTER